MPKNQWQKIEEIFNRAVVLPSAERRKFVKDVCGEDKNLCDEVLTLVEADSVEEHFLDEPVFSLGARLLDADDFLPEKSEFASYRVEKLLGKGGMGAVYLAKDKRLERAVALKILPLSLGANTDGVMRFRQEARTASAISHQNVAHIYEFGEENERYFLAMEYVEGKTLRELLKEKSIDISRALEIAIQIADALDATHKRGIVHRDIKPENVIVKGNGLVKVLDFGVAKLFDLQATSRDPVLSKISLVNTTPGTIMGTIGYISPEQLRSKKADFRADVWSLGVVLYEMLSGRKPFEGKTSEGIAKAILKKIPAPLSFSKIDAKDEASLKKIVAKTLQKAAAKRYKSAADLANDLRTLKQNMEFNRQFSSAGFSGENILSGYANTTGQTGRSTFLTKTKQFWENQSSSHKVLMVAGLIVLLTFSFGFSAQYFKRFYTNKSPGLQSFSPESRNRLQISNLFSTRRKPNGAITDAGFSPDGKLIAFTLWGNDSSDIYVKQVDKDEPIKTTDVAEAMKITGWNGKNQSPLWSPDGRHLAFVSDHDNKSGIWIVPFSGGTPIFQTSLEDAGLTCYLKKWSNDGKRIYYESCKKLYALDLDSGKISEVPLPEMEMVGNFNISNDEKMMTFVAIENKKQQIFTQSLETGEVKAVSKNDHHNWSPVFFPAKDRIAYSSDQNGISQIYVSGLTDPEPSQITFSDTNATYPVISPDGRKMVYVSETDDANIFSLDLKTGKEFEQTSNTKMQLFPNVSSNNEKMVFQTTQNQIFAGSLKIKQLGTEGEPSQINLIGGAPQWSPGNNAVAFLKQSEIDINIWIADTDELKEKQLTFGGITVEGYAQAPYNLMSIPFDWSPDGRKIVYSSKQSGFYNIWTIDADGGNPQMLTNNDDPKQRPSSALWSPDGTQISYVNRNQLDVKKIQYGISVLTNGKIQNLFESNLRLRLLGWSQKGSEVLAVAGSETDGDLIAISTLSKTKPQRLITLKGVNIDGVALSPDGQKIAYSARRNGVNNVFVFSINGNEMQLTGNQENTLYYSGITWSPDGSSLYYSKQSGGIQISMISDPG
jgi:Tol biopolymer transport system component/predicted Ser/Thr protein kinase